MDRIFKVGVLLLLGGILSMLITIYSKIPSPLTLGDIMNGKAETMEDLHMKIPLVYVDGNVGVNGTVEVEGTVDVGNTPLEVEISR